MLQSAAQEVFRLQKSAEEVIPTTVTLVRGMFFGEVLAQLD